MASAGGELLQPLEGLRCTHALGFSFPSHSSIQISVRLKKSWETEFGSSLVLTNVSGVSSILREMHGADFQGCRDLQLQLEDTTHGCSSSSDGHSSPPEPAGLSVLSGQCSWFSHLAFSSEMFDFFFCCLMLQLGFASENPLQDE